METAVALIAIVICVLVAAAISQRIQGTIVTLPMVYTVLGLILSGRGSGKTALPFGTFLALAVILWLYAPASWLALSPL